MSALIRDKIYESIEDEYVLMIDELKSKRPRIKRLDEVKKNIFWKRIKSLDIGCFKDRESELIKQIENLLKQAEDGVIKPDE